MTGFVSFVSSGPGDADLLTVRAARSSVTITPRSGTAAQASPPFQPTSTTAGRRGHSARNDGARATQARPADTHATPCSLNAARNAAAAGSSPSAAGAQPATQPGRDSRTTRERRRPKREARETMSAFCRAQPSVP